MIFENHAVAGVKKVTPTFSKVIVGRRAGGKKIFKRAGERKQSESHMECVCERDKEVERWKEKESGLVNGRGGGGGEGGRA